MKRYVAKRLRFRNGDRHSIVQVVGGLPVHEVVLFVRKYRTKGRAANTIHLVCRSLALLYRLLERKRIDLHGRLSEGTFLTIPELENIAVDLQYRADDLDDEYDEADEPGLVSGKSNVINIAKIGFRNKVPAKTLKAVEVGSQATRIRYIASYLEFLATYVGATLEPKTRLALKADVAAALASFKEHVPPVPKRAKLGARTGLSVDEQKRLLDVVHPDSPLNPWKRRFVRQRNWLIVVVLLATGMRIGELLGLQIDDLLESKPKFEILRRADAQEDSRPHQPGTKTSDRVVEVSPPIMRALLNYIHIWRQAIPAARAIPQVIVSEDGGALSSSSIDKIFLELRAACPGLPVTLTSHVMRHTWNERFSEQAELMGLSDTVEERARNDQQGWSENSKMAATYTRRHTAKKGREVSLKLQEQLDEQLSNDK